MDKAEYKKSSINSVKIADTMRFDKRNVVIAFEGMDAAGKGGIKRIVKNLDPREYDIHCIGAPERFEARHPYLWRFWNRINEAEKLPFLTVPGMVVCWSSVLKDLLHLSNGKGHMTKSIALKRLI